MANPTGEEGHKTPIFTVGRVTQLGKAAKAPGNQYDLTRIWNAIPFVMPPEVSYNRNTKMGRGMICPVTVAANVTQTIQHNLGRIAVGAICLANGPNNSLFPAFVRFTTTGTSAKQPIQASAALVGALVWFY